eukprot:350108_1
MIHNAMLSPRSSTAMSCAQIKISLWNHNGTFITFNAIISCFYHKQRSGFIQHITRFLDIQLLYGFHVFLFLAQCFLVFQCFFSQQILFPSHWCLVSVLFCSLIAPQFIPFASPFACEAIPKCACSLDHFQICNALFRVFSFA